MRLGHTEGVEGREMRVELSWGQRAVRTLSYAVLRNNMPGRPPFPDPSPASIVPFWVASWEKATRDMRKNKNFGVRTKLESQL